MSNEVEIIIGAKNTSGPAFEQATEEERRLAAEAARAAAELARQGEASARLGEQIMAAKERMRGLAEQIAATGEEAKRADLEKAFGDEQRIVSKLSRVKLSLDEVIQAEQKAAREAEEAARREAAAAEVAAVATEESSRKIGRATEEASVRSRGHLGVIGQATEDLVGKLKTVALGAGMAFGAAGAAITAFGIKSAADMQTSRVSFELMLGSAQKASEFLKQLQQFAVVTPFQLADLQTYASRLLAVGTNANDIIPILRRIGDATAAAGSGSYGIERAVNALNEMKLAGDVSLIHLKELAFAGVPVFDALAASLHKTTAEVMKMVSSNEIKPEMVFGAIEAGAGGSFARINGMMDKQSATLAGKWSNLKDSAAQTFGHLFEPALPGLSRMVDSIGSGIPKVIDMLKGYAHQIGDVFKGSDVGDKIFESMGKAAKEIIPFLKQQLDSLVSTVRENKEGLISFGHFIANDLIPAFKVLAGSAIFSFINGIKVAIGVMAMIGSAVAPVKHAFEATAHGITSAWHGVTGFFAGIGHWFAGPFAGFFVDAWHKITAAFSMVTHPQQTFRQFADHIAHMAGELVGNVLKFILTLPGRVQEIFSSLAERGKATFLGFVNDVVSFARSLPGRAQAALTSIVDVVRNIMQWAWTTGRDKVAEGIQWIINEVMALPGKLHALGDSIISGLVNGIQAQAGRLWDLARSMAGNFISGFLHALDSHSPSRVMSDRVAPTITEGLILGIRRDHGRVAAAGGNLADAVTGGARGTAGWYGGGVTGAGQAPGGAFSLEIKAGGSALDRLLVEVLRGAIVKKGGNVQAVLGRTPSGGR